MIVVQPASAQPSGSWAGCQQQLIAHGVAAEAQLHGPDSFAPGPNRFAVLAADGDDGSAKAQGKEPEPQRRSSVPDTTPTGETLGLAGETLGHAPNALHTAQACMQSGAPNAAGVVSGPSSEAMPPQQQLDTALGSTRHRRGKLVSPTDTLPSVGDVRRFATAMPRPVSWTTHPGDCENSPSPICDVVERGAVDVDALTAKRLVPDVTPSNETLRRGPNVEGYPRHVLGQGASGTN